MQIALFVSPDDRTIARVNHNKMDLGDYSVVVSTIEGTQETSYSTLAEAMVAALDECGVSAHFDSVLHCK